jgi:hypothetical protein
LLLDNRRLDDRQRDDVGCVQDAHDQQDAAEAGQLMLELLAGRGMGPGGGGWKRYDCLFQLGVKFRL